MEFVIIAVLAILGAALIAGGVVMLRGGKAVGVRAVGAACVAAGVVMWLIILFITPVFTARSGNGQSSAAVGQQNGPTGNTHCYIAPQGICPARV